MSEDDSTEQHLARVTNGGIQVRTNLVKRGLDNYLARNFRIVSFSADYSVGDLYIRDRSDAGEIAWQVNGRKVGEARGDVRVPLKNDLRLVMTEEAFENLLSDIDLLFLKPDDLQALVFPAVGVSIASLGFLTELKGLKLLKVRLTQVRDEEIQRLKALDSLQWLYLCGEELSHDEIENLKNELPNVVVVTESTAEGLVNDNSPYTAKQMMEVVNEKGYRDENGLPFTDVNDFLRALELDAAGVREFYSIENKREDSEESIVENVSDLPFKVLDELTYEQVMPYFVSGIKRVHKNGMASIDDLRSLMRVLRDEFEFDLHQIRAMKPFIIRFIREFEAGEIELNETKTSDESKNAGFSEQHIAKLLEKFARHLDHVEQQANQNDQWRAARAKSSLYQQRTFEERKATQLAAFEAYLREGKQGLKNAIEWKKAVEVLEELQDLRKGPESG